MGKRSSRKKTLKVKKAALRQAQGKRPEGEKKYRKDTPATPVESPDGVPASGQFNGAREAAIRSEIRVGLNGGERFRDIARIVSERHTISSDAALELVMDEYRICVQTNENLGENTVRHPAGGGEQVANLKNKEKLSLFS